jgi:hypothetical protein
MKACLYSLVLLCFLQFSPFCFASNETVNFFTFSKSVLEKSIDEIIAKSTDTISSVTFTTTIDEYDTFLEPIVAQILQEKDINFFGKLPIKNAVHLRMQIENFSIQFSFDEQKKDTLIETGIWKARLLSNNDNRQIVSVINSSYNRMTSIPNGMNTWTLLPNVLKSEMPSASSSLFDDIITPVLFLGTAVITLLLLFTVRTQ